MTSSLTQSRNQATNWVWKSYHAAHLSPVMPKKVRLGRTNLDTRVPAAMAKVVL